MVESTKFGSESTCGPYKIIKTLGAGMTGKVKLVEKDGEQYAMKIFNVDKSNREYMTKMAKKEFRITENVDSKLIPKYYEFNHNATKTNKKGEEKQVVYLVMELVKGVELLEFINHCETMDDSFVRYIFLQVCTVIHKLHQAGIAHRDIKLDNIMITEDFQVKLIDFGYSLKLEGKRKDGYMKTKLGTAMYMAPEVSDKTVKY